MLPDLKSSDIHPVLHTPFKVIETETEWISVRHGTRLSARVWRPEVDPDTKVPAVIEIIPYRRRDGKLPIDERIHPYWAGNGIADKLDSSCSTGIECAKVQLSSTARKGATQ